MSPLLITLNVFALIFIAELPDKTAVASLVLATRHKPLPVFVGACLALTIQSVVAVLFGRLLSMLPPRAVHIGAGVLFLVTAIAMWRKQKEDGSDTHEKDRGPSFVAVMSTSFLVIFMAEWGDLTQIATAALVAQFGAPVAVFVGATLALWTVVGIAVTVGHHAGKLLPAHVVQRVAGVVFALVGVLFLTGRL